MNSLLLSCHSYSLTAPVHSRHEGCNIQESISSSCLSICTTADAGLNLEAKSVHKSRFNTSAVHILHLARGIEPDRTLGSSTQGRTEYTRRMGGAHFQRQVCRALPCS